MAYIDVTYILISNGTIMVLFYNAAKMELTWQLDRVPRAALIIPQPLVALPMPKSERDDVLATLVAQFPPLYISQS